MIDIVERLRHRTEYLPHAGMMKLLEEAADEIERLRAALQYIADHPVNDDVADYARNAYTT